MNDSIYNKLPDYIKRKHKIVYSELLCDNVTIFKNKDERWGVLTCSIKFGLFTSYYYLVKPIYDSVGFNKELKLIEAVKYEDAIWNRDKNTFFYFDINGVNVWQSKKGEGVRIDKFGNIILNSGNKFGVLDKNFTQLIEPKYQQLNSLNSLFFIALRDEKYGIINRSDSIILGFEFDEIFNVVENNRVIVKKNGTYYSFYFNDHSLTALPFSKILRASSNTYNAPSVESLRFYKSIIDLQENTAFDDYQFEMIRNKGRWGIIDGAGKTIIPNEYCFIDFLSNPKYFKVGMGEIEILDYEDEEQNHRISIANVKWGIVDINNNIIVPIDYNWIDEVESTIWVVYKGGVVYYNDDYQKNYWTIINGKLGVYNLNKRITPIEYDTIKENWFRIKEYIFVQHGTKYFDDNSPDYDVFTLEGAKIEANKPKPRDYTYYG